MTFYGDEARLESVARARNPHSHLGLPEVALPLAGREEEQRRMIAHGGALVPGPLCDQSRPARRAAAARAALRPIPMSTCRSPPAPFPQGGGLKLLHMPTHRAIKGSDLIAAAVARLAAQGLDISLTQVENADNAEARAAIAGCHVLVDQLRVGWYGGVAVEAMAQGAASSPICTRATSPSPRPISSPSCRSSAPRPTRSRRRWPTSPAALPAELAALGARCARLRRGLARSGPRRGPHARRLRGGRGRRPGNVKCAHAHSGRVRRINRFETRSAGG
jgi:hypothetical protein